MHILIFLFSSLCVSIHLSFVSSSLAVNTFFQTAFFLLTVECRLPGLLYVDDSVLCGESEEELRAMVGCVGEEDADAEESIPQRPSKPPKRSI